MCQRRCHRERSHKKVECTHRVELVCEKQHKRRVACSKRNDRCDKCIKEQLELERRIKRDLELERKRLEQQKAYARELQEIQDELDHEKRKIKYMAVEDDEKSALAKQREELKAAKESRAQYEQVKKLQKERADAAAAKKAAAGASPGKPTQPGSSSTNVPGVPNTAQEEWEHLKRTEAVLNGPLDELMDMIGLEDVKSEFLEIKSVVDTKVSRLNLGVLSLSANSLSSSGKVWTSANSALGLNYSATQDRERLPWPGSTPAF